MPVSAGSKHSARISQQRSSASNRWIFTVRSMMPPLEQRAVSEQFPVPVGHLEAHVAFLAALAAQGIELNAGVHDGAMVVAGLAVDLLLEPRE
jgi:hypothetical protein